MSTAKGLSGSGRQSLDCSRQRPSPLPQGRSGLRQSQAWQASHLVLPVPSVLFLSLRAQTSCADDDVHACFSRKGSPKRPQAVVPV